MRNYILLPLFIVVAFLPISAYARFSTDESGLLRAISSVLWETVSGIKTLNTITAAPPRNSLVAQVSSNPTLRVVISGAGQGVVIGNGIDCTTTCDKTGTQGELVLLQATSIGNSVFTGWGGDCTGTTPRCFVTLSGSKSAYAWFDQTAAPQKYYTVKVTKNGTGSGSVYSGTNIECGSDCTHYAPEGTTVTMYAYPDPYFRFAGWSGGGCSGLGSCTVTLSRDTEVSAYFDSVERPYNPTTLAEPTYTLTVARNGNGDGYIEAPGISCGSSCSRSDVKWTSIKLRAFPQSNSFFVGWSGAGCSGKGECEVLLNQSYTVTATFQANIDTRAVAPPPPPAVPSDLYTVFVGKIGSGSGTVTGPSINCGGGCSTQIARGTPIVLTATPSASSDFSGWSGEGCSGGGVCSFTVTKNIIAIANFSKSFTQESGYYEAEQAELSESMSAVSDQKASGGRYISSGVRDFGKAVVKIYVPTTGTYVLWARIKSPDSRSDSFYISVDGSDEDIYDTAEDLWSPNWQWTRVTGRAANGGLPNSKNLNPKQWQLGAGTHFVTFRNRDPNTKLDRIFLTSSFDVKPEGYTSAPTEQINVGTTEFFTKNLSVGSQGIEVKKLQVFLNSAGFTISTRGSGSPGNEGDYYGTATADAVVRFQNMYKSELLTPRGLSSGTGVFDATTRKKANSMVIVPPTPRIVPPPVVTPPPALRLPP
jgi:hypothetical protein